MRWLALLVLLVPAASAGHGSVVWFLEGDATSGTLSPEFPQDEKAGTRLIVATEASYDLTRFSSHEWAGADRLRGVLLAGLWLDDLPVPGYVEATIMTEDQDGWTAMWNVSIPVGQGSPAPPDPASLLPSDPTDPEAAAYEAAAKVMGQLRNPPMIADFGRVDLPLMGVTGIAIAFRLADNTTAPTVLEYGSMIAPSFVVVPFHKDAVPSSTSGPGPQTSTTATTQRSGSTTVTTTEITEAKDTPIPVALVLVALVIALRRR